MTPNFHSPLTPFPLDLKEDQHHQLFFLNSQSSASASSSSSTAPCRNFFEPAQEQAGGYYQKEPYHLQHQQEDKIFFSQEGSWDHQTTVINESDSGLKFSIWQKGERNENQGENSASVKWMSSKMRLMKKMMHSDGGDNIPNSSMQKFEDHHKQPSETNQNNSYSTTTNNNTIRVCADCNTTKTPLWRSGPRGPKSLCNACGIRQRKARRAMAAAAAAAANGTALAADMTSKKSKVHHKDKSKTSSSSNSSLPFKKRCKFGSPSRGKKKLCIEDLTIILSKNSAFQRVFPQDEKEAAILLMALSYGLVQG